MNEALIRLFRAVPITTKEKGGQDVSLLKRTIKEGFVFAPEVLGNYFGGNLETVFNTVKKEIGLSGRQANNAFHKSWNKVRNASLEELVLEQIIHYLTTYGYESEGIYSQDTVYIPKEVLKVPNIDTDKLPLIVIKGLTKEEIKARLLEFVNSGVALHEETIKDVIEIALFVKLSVDEIETIRNKEVKSALYVYLGLVPKHPVEFLRLVIYKATDKTLLIKNVRTIKKIEERNNLDLLRMFQEYERVCGLEPLATIFYRFKPLFLAFKSNGEMNRIINKIRKLAIKHHKPMPEDLLNTITAKISRGENIDTDKLNSELARVNIFRKIRLAYALKFRTTDATAILYKVRNGKSYATNIELNNKQRADEILSIVIDSIVESVKKNVEGKKIYIPENLHYALPATEKQFSGMLPAGTYVSIPNNMIFGVHWTNVENNRIDLDLSLINADEKYGWDASYRNEGRDILFSGDMTDAPAPHGASELFYVGKQANKALLLMLNYYNFDEEIPVPFQIFVAKEQVNQLNKNYVVNPNNIVARTQSIINQKQKMIGLILTTEESKFYFTEAYLGNSISSSKGNVSENTRQYLKALYSNSIDFNDILVKAGATITTVREEADLDLSPEALAKDTILNLVKS